MEIIIDEVTNNSRLHTETRRGLLSTVVKLETGLHKVNSLLKQSIIGSADRNGLSILAAALPHLSNDDLLEKLPMCINVCLKSHIPQDNNESVLLGYRVFQQLLERCCGSQELERAVNNQMVGEFVSTLASTSPSTNRVALACLEAVLRRFAKQCIGQRTNIEKFLIQFLDSESSAIVIKAGICATLVQQVRPSGDFGFDAKTSWNQHFLSLCHASQTLIEEVFSSFSETLKQRHIFQATEGDISFDPQRNSGPLKEFLYSIAAQDSSASAKGKMVDGNMNISTVEKYSMISLRLKNVLVFLQAALTTWYPTGKLVNPQAVLDPLFLLISLSKTGSRANSSLDDLLVESFLPGLKAAALRTLDAVLYCLQMSMLPYSKLFFRMALQAIQFSKTQEHSTLHKELRVQAYSTLKQWLNVVKCHNFSESNTTVASDKTVDTLIATILKDIMIPEKSIVLTVNQRPNLKNLSKKVRRRLVNSQLGSSSLAQHAPGSDGSSPQVAFGLLESKLRVAAFGCLETILLTSGCFLKEMSHKKIQNTLVLMCSTVGLSSEERIAFYKCLEATKLGCKLGVPAPTQYLIDIFSNGIMDPDLSIATFCGRALRAIRLCIHQSPTSLSFSAAEQHDGHDEATNGYAVTDSNRKALNEILGDKLYNRVVTDINGGATGDILGKSRKQKMSPDDVVQPQPKRVKQIDVQEAITQIDLVGDDTVINLESSDGSDVELDKTDNAISDDLNSHHKTTSEPSKYINLVNDDIESDAVVPAADETLSEGTGAPLEIADIDVSGEPEASVEGRSSPQIVISDVELVRTPLSFPLAKFPSSQESTHSDDLVITCGQNRDDETTSSQDAVRPVVKPVTDNCAGIAIDTISGVTIKDMLSTFVDEVAAVPSQP